VIILLQPGHTENQHSFHNGGTAAALSMIHHNLPLLPHYSVGASLGTDMTAADGVKMEAPSWEGGHLGIADVQDKQQVSFWKICSHKSSCNYFYYFIIILLFIAWQRLLS